MSTTPNAPTAAEFPAISPQAEIEALRSMNTRQVEIIGELEAELSNVSAAIGTVEFMDLPDGGDVSLSEQVRRMRAALLAARREVERMQFALRAIVEWKDFPPTVDGLSFMKGFAGGALAPPKDWCVAAAHREAESEIERLQWQITCLRTALENWGRHFDWCASRKDSSSACDCGLAAALATQEEK